MHEWPWVEFGTASAAATTSSTQGVVSRVIAALFARVICDGVEGCLVLVFQRYALSTTTGRR